MKKIVVIGASAASMAFMTKLRSFDQESSIICFSAEQALPYNRCLLADFLTHDISLEKLFLKPETFFNQSAIDLRLDHRAIQFDFERKKVLIRHGLVETWHEYDYLFLGMGTRPYISKFLQDVATDGIFTFHTLHDMQNIDEFLQQKNSKHAVVLGAGLNGIEAASSLGQKGVPVTLIEAAPQILPGQLDGQAVSWVLQRLQAHGVQVMVGQKMTDIRINQGQLQAVVLENGQIVVADLLIIAAGSTPNSDLFKDSELELVNSLLKVDRSLKTNLESVLAAGDLCSVPDFRTGQAVRSTTWSDAMLQGLCAATTLSATPRSYLGAIGLRDSYFFGKDFYACGQTTGFVQPVQEQVLMNNADSFAKLYFEHDQLIGFVLIGDISRLSELKQWYMTQNKP